MTDELCLEPNSAEYSFMADRYFCSLPKGHDPETEPHIAYYNHKRQFGVRWWGPWKDGTDWKMPGEEGGHAVQKHDWWINPEHPRDAGVSPNMFVDTPNNVMLAMEDIVNRTGIIKARKGGAGADAEAMQFQYFVEIFDGNGHRWAYGASNDSLDRAIRYALGYFYNHLPEGW